MPLSDPTVANTD